MLDKAGVTLRLGRRGGRRRSGGFDEVIIATGVVPRDPEIPGQDGPNVLSYIDVLRGGAKVGERVAIVGAGGIGFDVAEFLAQQGESPTVHPDGMARRMGRRAIRRSARRADDRRPEPPARAQVTLLQRKPEKPGRGLGQDHRLDPPRGACRPRA